MLNKNYYKNTKTKNKHVSNKSNIKDKLNFNKKYIEKKSGRK